MEVKQIDPLCNNPGEDMLAGDVDWGGIGEEEKNHILSNRQSHLQMD